MRYHEVSPPYIEGQMTITRFRNSLAFSKSILKRLLPALLLPALIHAQTIDTYQNPPGIRWKTIETAHFEIVFPDELSEEGLRVANTMEYLYGPLNQTLDAKRKRISLFLTNQGAIANGYVNLAPRKSEWYHQPVQGTSTGSGEWYRLLAAHEGRHMVQFDKVNTGFTRLAGWATGESGVSALSMFSIPLWWWEGDAVGMETALTRSGRGRIPEFDMGIRTQLLNNIRYSYSKEYIGSYKDWTPSWYELGYPLVSHVRQKYGPSAWNRIIRRTSKWSFWPFSFSHALKKETQKGLSELYEETLTELEKAWRNQIPVRTYPQYRILNRKLSTWTQYRFPQYLDDSTVVAQEWSYDVPWSIVAIDTRENEKILKQISPLEPNGTKGSTAAGKIVWDEAIPDIRWGTKTLPSIVVMDVRTGRTRRMAGGFRYFNPSFSPDAGRIAAVEFEKDRKCALVILDAGTGELLERIPSPDNAFLQSPCWSPDGQSIVFTLQNNRGKGISVLDVKSRQIREAFAPGWAGISHPVLFDHWVLFSSPKSGIDNIHAVDMETKIEYQVTSLPYGAFSPQVSPDGKKLLFSGYSPDGMEVCEADFDPSLWTEPDSAAADATGYEKTLAAQENGPMLDESQIPKIIYPIQDYRPVSHLLNVHSWYPVSGSHEFGLLLVSRDKLNTTSLTFGPMIDTNEGKVRLEADAIYAGVFPVIDFGLSHGERELVYKDEKSEERTDKWTETSTRLGLSIPLDLSRDVHITRLQASLDASFVRVSDKYAQDRPDPLGGDLVPLHYQLTLSRYREGAIRDVAPRWAQDLRIEYRHTPFDTDYRGSQFSSEAILYLPGILKHHSLLCRAAWEEQKPDNYLFPISFPFSRGYGSVFHKRLAHASASYTFPLFYPDVSLGSFAYLKRIEGRLFYDYTIGMDGNAKTPYRSTGVEIGFETHFFNLHFPLIFGIRCVHRIEDGENRVEAVFDFNSL